eukprot:758044-Hanusia_phi.AAC.3
MCHLQQDLFIVDGVLVNALGEEVSPATVKKEIAVPQAMSATTVTDSINEMDASDSEEELALPWEIPADVAAKVKKETKDKHVSEAWNLLLRTLTVDMAEQNKERSKGDVMEEYNRRLQMKSTLKGVEDRNGLSRLSQKGSSLVRERLVGMEDASKSAHFPASKGTEKEEQVTRSSMPVSFSDDQRFKDNWEALG